MQTAHWFTVDTLPRRIALLAAALALAPLTAASAQDPAATTPPAAGTATAAPPAAVAPLGQGTLDRARGTGKLSLGYFAAAKPLTFTDAAGAADGYGVALCRAIADAVKAETGRQDLAVEFVPVAADAFDALAAGRIDVLCAPSQPTLARRAFASFSIPVYVGGTSALVRKDAAAALRAKLNGKSIANQPVWRGSPMIANLAQRKFVVVPGTASERWLKTKLQELGVNSVVTTVPNLQAGVQQVNSGSADALLAERSLLLDIVKNDPAGANLEVGERNVDFKAMSLAVRRGDEDFLLLVDRTLSRLYQGGKVDGIYGKYFGPPSAGTRDWFRRAAEPE